jgi:hypothetical protein
MTAMPFTTAEKRIVQDAFNAIEYVASTTNWTDSGEFKRTYKMKRKEADSKTEAQASIVKAWHAGATAWLERASIETYPFGFAEHYQIAWRLGASQARDRMESDYTGPLVRKALDACPMAIAAGERAQQQWLDEKGYAQ